MLCYSQVTAYPGVATQVHPGSIGDSADNWMAAAPVHDLLDELDADHVIQIVDSSLGCRLHTHFPLDPCCQVDSYSRVTVGDAGRTLIDSDATSELAPHAGLVGIQAPSMIHAR